MSQRYLLAIDQGTTNSRAHIFTDKGTLISTQQLALKNNYLQPGWVEQDPEEIWQNTLMCCREAIKQSQFAVNDIAAIGITNQRETTIIWDKKTGEPIYPAIVWQDRRTASMCDHLKQNKISQKIPEKTGLLIDPYFSATKILWILEHVANARARAERGELLFGTVDTFLLWRLTKGKMHATDATNASRTLLFNIRTQQWDSDILHALNIPESLLPSVLNSSDTFGSSATEFFRREIPIASLIGDQQAATVGQACFQPGMAKATYGTGCFVLLNTGDKLVASTQQLLSTIAYRLNNRVVYGLEGSIFSAGTIVKWLRDQLNIIQSAAETENLAQRISSTDGVYLIPAFNGLGAPYWDPHARAAIVGLSSSSTREHIVRAGLEAIAYQTRDLLEAMQRDAVQSFSTMRVDGGMSANNWLMQYIADILNRQLCRPVCTETTALGAAFLAGLQVGIYQSLDEIAELWKLDKEFVPSMSPDVRNDLYQGWLTAIQKL